MTWLPVVERELRVAARRRATYRIRFWAVTVMLAFFAWHMIDESSRPRASIRAGRELLEILSLWAFLFAILVGVFATSDSISEEKREGTLGLLFLTDLKGYDVILGKLVAHSINAFYALVAILPILGMPLLIGGVSSEQFAKMILALISAIFLSLAAGIFVSTHSRNERKAIVFTFLLLAFITCVPFLLTFWIGSNRIIPPHKIWRGLMFSPGFAIAMAMDSPSFFPSVSYWYCIGCSCLAALAFLFNAAVTAPRSWAENGPKPNRAPAAQKKERSATRKSHRKLLDKNPFLWLAMRGEASRQRVWLFVLSILGIWLYFWFRVGSVMLTAEVVLPTAIILHLGLKFWTVGEASRRFVEDRRNSAMEFLLSTPLTEGQIVFGQWRALLRQFIWPIAFVLLWEIIMICAILKSRGGWNYNYSREEFPQIVCATILFPADFVALGWAGMWLGMTSKGRGRAMLMALAVVIVLPMALTQLCMTFGNFTGIWGMSTPPTSYMMSQSREELEIIRAVIRAGLGLIIDFLIVVWAATRLMTNFRRVAGGSGRR